MNPDASSGSTKFLSINYISNLNAELPAYLVKCQDIDETYDKLQWYKCQQSTLPHWGVIAKRILAVQPS